MVPKGATINYIKATNTILMGEEFVTEIIEEGNKLVLRFECNFGILSLPFDNLDEIAKLKEDLGKAIYIFQHKDIFY